MTRRHARRLAAIGLLVAVGVPLVLAGWVLAVTFGGLDLVLGCRLAGMSTMALLATSIALPLVVAPPGEDRARGFVVLWFSMAAGFNLFWELPLVVFRSAITGLEVTVANLPRGIAWWGYTLSDAHYRDVTPFMESIEVTWLVANAIAVFGLVGLRRGAATRGYLLLGIAGALQAYNAGLYVVANGIMDHYGNIAPGSVLAQLLYWGFNLLWTGAAAAGSVVAFRLMLAAREETRTRAANATSAATGAPPVGPEEALAPSA